MDGEYAYEMKTIRVWIAALALLAVVLLLAWKPILLAIGGFLIVHDALQQADLIHVISGPDDRVDYSVRLYEQGYGERLFYTGRGSQADAQRRRAIRQGVPPEAVATDGAWVTSTYSEAIRLQAYIAQSETPIRSVIVISDAYHMRRARWAYRQVLGDQVEVWMAPVPFEDSPLRREWWSHPRSRKRVCEEYLKLVYYYARYKVFRGPIQEWLASFDQN